MKTVIDIDDHQLTRYVLRYAPNLPEPLMLDFLRDAARDFCTRTKCWREVDMIEVASPDYEIMYPSPDAEVVYIEEVQLDNRSIVPINIDDLDRKHKGWQYVEDDEDDEGQAFYITQLEPNSFSLYPKQSGTLQARFTLMPSSDAETFPSNLVERFGRIIGLGAASQALLMPDAEFSNPNVGAYLATRFEKKLREAQNMVSRGQQKSKPRTVGNFF